MRRRLVTTGAGTGLLALTLALSGCTGASTAGTTTTAPASNGSATPSTSTTATTVPGTASAAAVLAEIQQDLAGIDGAAAQANTDISAAESAQAQNDNP